MSTIVYQTNSNGIKYAYESVSYWDKDKKAPRSKRKYIGKVDPETGDIIPPRSGKKVSTGKTPMQAGNPSNDPEVATLRSELVRKEKETEALKKELSDTKIKYSAAMRTLSEICASASDALNTAKG